MPGLLAKTTSALAYELVGLQGSALAGVSPDHDDILRFVTRQMDLMPGLLALALKAATLAFAASSLVVDGAFFHQEESSRRKARVEAWRRSKLGPCRDLIKFYSSLVVLALYSRPGYGRNWDPAG
jgi:hypothetical protein